MIVILVVNTLCYKRIASNTNELDRQTSRRMWRNILPLEFLDVETVYIQ